MAEDQSNVSSILLETSKPRNRMQYSDVNFFLRKRYLVMLLTFCGILMSFILRTNLSIAIVEMTSDKQIISGNSTFTQKAEFDWDSRMKGFILSAFSIGYFFCWLAGLMSVKYGGVTTFGLGIVITSLLTILTPLFIRLHISVFILVRILEGIFESFSLVSYMPIFLHWAPPDERCRLLILSMSGAYVGAAINYPFSGFLAHHYGWQAVFYVTGGLGLVVFVFWIMLVSDDPASDNLMTQTERDYLKSFITGPVKKKKISYPWKEMLTSKPVWAYLNEYFSFYWSYSFLMYCLPLDVKDVYSMNIQNIGLITAIPVVAASVGSIIAACLSDYVRSHTNLGKSTIHRICITTGQVTCVITTFIAGIWANFEQSIVCFAVARFFFRFAQTSYIVLAIDAFREYSGVVKGFALTTTAVPYFLNPIVMGYMVADHSRASWNLYFLFLNIFNIWSLVMWYLYGSGERQPWATLETKEKIDEVS